MSITIAVLTDFHYSDQPNPDRPERRGEIVDLIFQKAVERLNKTIKPDVTVLGGDLIENPDSPLAKSLLGKLQEVASSLESKVIAIAGNHDPDVNTFYEIFDRPEDYLDIGGIRLIPFLDKQEPEYNASRNKTDLQRMEKLSSSFSGPIVYLQHVPIFPPGTSDCQDVYLNVEEILEVIRSLENTTLSVSGHFHRGVDLFNEGKDWFVVVPALYEIPFRFLSIKINDQGKISSRLETLGE